MGRTKNLLEGLSQEELERALYTRHVMILITKSTETQKNS